MPARVPAKLASARAYWRISAKFRQAGQYRQADHYHDVAERFYQAYRRDKEYLATSRQR